MKRVFLFVLTLFVLLTGCGGSDGYSVDSSEQERTGETTFESPPKGLYAASGGLINLLLMQDTSRRSTGSQATVNTSKT